ncbi:MAG: molecular chaperone DnaJ [Gemmatimonadetes bacterium]|nr:molecular chaperone DnaJ [Gemmatimonadota bacterium]
MARDFYDVLGVPRDATEGDLKKAYRKLAMQYHPDRNNGDRTAEERFKEVTEAYEVLRDADKRARYDRYGTAGLSGPSAGWHHFDLSEALSVFMRDFGGMGGFDGIFGGGERARRARQRGQDVQIVLRLTLAEVAKGVTRKVKLKTIDTCQRCKGRGTADGSTPERCGTCGGSGEVRRATQSFFGQFVSVVPCPGCGGEGTVIRKPCPDCRGEGRVRVDKTVEVEVPGGISSNNYLTLRGQGAVGPRGGPRGDLLVGIEVEDDPRFERSGDDVIYELLISFSQAALGGAFAVPTPEGEAAEVQVRAGMQSGSVITLRGKGLPSVSHGRRGDLHVRLHVWTPTELSPEQEELFRRLASLEGKPPQTDGSARRLWDRMKEALG